MLAAIIGNLFSSLHISAANAAFGPSTAGANTLVRVNNSLTYYTPENLGGFFASAQVATAEGAPATATNGNS